MHRVAERPNTMLAGTASPGLAETKLAPNGASEGFRVTFTGHDVRHADGRQLQRVGIEPHVRVAPTVAEVRAGRDEIRERAIAYVKQEMSGSQH